jgi:hypothetical protein
LLKAGCNYGRLTSMGGFLRWHAAAVLITALCGCSLGGCSKTTNMASFAPWHDKDLADFKQQLDDIDSQLATLAHFTMQTGAGAIGYRSADHITTAHEEWVQIDLGDPGRIDEIVIVPTIYRRFDSQLQADGFPEAFRVVVGTGDVGEGVVVASFTTEDHLLPRIAPVVIPCRVEAAWVRVEATRLSTRGWDGKHVLQLSEILIFRGEDNVAIGRPVTASSSVELDHAGRHTRFLVDGFVPYLMDAAGGDQGVDFIVRLSGDEPLSLTIDLGDVHPVSRIHLHAIGTSDNIPQAHQSDFGIPRRMIVEGAKEPDFSATTVLSDYQRESILDAGPVIVRSFPETATRFVRLTVTEPWMPTIADQPVFGIAEVECFASGRNVALGRPVTMQRGGVAGASPVRPLAAITDGRNFYGTILPVRRWLNELSRRHDLEVERPAVVAAIQARYQRQATLIRWLGGLAVVLGGLVAISIMAISRRPITTSSKNCDYSSTRCGPSPNAAAWRPAPVSTCSNLAGSMKDWRPTCVAPRRDSWPTSTISLKSKTNTYSPPFRSGSRWAWPCSTKSASPTSSVTPGRPGWSHSSWQRPGPFNSQ